MQPKSKMADVHHLGSLVELYYIIPSISTMVFKLSFKTVEESYSYDLIKEKTSCSQR